MSALLLEWGCFNRVLLKRKDLVAAGAEVGVVLKSITSIPAQDSVS